MIVCLGATPTVQRTLFFDRVTTDAVNRAQRALECASGKSINVARVLHALQTPAIALGFVGGRRGDYIEQSLRDEAIRFDFVRVDAQTRLCTTVIDRHAGTTTELVEESARVAAADYATALQKLKTHLEPCGMLILSGSLTPNAPQDFYADATAAAHAVGAWALLDARGVPLELALEHRPWLVKPNLAELAATVGMAIDDDASLRAAIVKLIARGAQWAVITNGAHPAVASDGKSFWRIISPKVKAVNPIGSGDSFAAGLAAAAVAGREVPDACRQAAACGAANALTPTPGTIDVATMRELESRTMVERF